MTEHQQESQLITRTNHDLSNEPLGALPSLSSRVMFWRPKFLCESDWLDHVPFAFWLIESVKPRILVELGVGGGASYFAFCQAIDKLNIAGRCYGFDNWSSHTEPQFQAALKYNQQQYEEFSRLESDNFADAAGHFLDQSVDLLHINPAADSENLSAVFHCWLPKLSEKAVVLLHHSQSAAKQVAELKQQLQAQYRHFEFLQQHGLLVVVIKEIPSDSLSRLLEIRPGEKTYEIVQNVFSRLGKACSETMNARAAKQQLALIHDELADSRQQLQERQQRIDDLLGHLSDHKNWLTKREQEAVQLSAQLNRTEQQKLEQQQALNERISLLENLRNELKLEAGHLLTSVERLTNENSQLQLKQIEQDAELQVARQQLQQLQQAQTEANQLNTTLTSDRAELQRQLQVQANELQQVHQQLASITRNTEQQRHDKERQLAEAAQQQQQLQTELSQLKQHLQQSQSENSTLIAAQKKQQEELSQLKQHLQQSQSENSTLIAAQKKQQEELSQLKQHLQQSQSENSTLVAAQKKQQEELNQLKQHLQQSQSENSTLVAAQKKQQEVTGQVQAQLKQSQTELADLAGQQQALAMQNQQLTTELSEQQAQCASLLAQLQQQKSDLEQKDAELQQCNHELAELASQQQSIVMHNQQLTTELSEQQAQSAALVAQLQQQRSDLEQKDAELQQCYHELAVLGQVMQQQHAVAAGQQAVANTELRYKNRQLSQLKNSLAWKLSWPVRLLTGDNVSKTLRQKQLRQQMQLIEESGLFDENWYLGQYPDVQNSGVSALEHYLRFGGFEGRKPNPDFDSAFYLAQYQDVVDAGLNPLVHYVKFGRAEHRLFSAQAFD
jgi:hypothetical protein